jgi:hypothetical protein
MPERPQRDAAALIRHAEAVGAHRLVELIGRALISGTHTPSQAARHAYVTLVAELGLDAEDADRQR